MKEDLYSLEIRCELSHARLLLDCEIDEKTFSSQACLFAYSRKLRETSAEVRQTASDIRQLSQTIRDRAPRSR